MRGQVIWFNVKNGYGFIKGQDGTDYFAHYSKIKSEPGEFRTLEKGAVVEFDPQTKSREDGDKPQAFDIKIIEGVKDESLPGNHAASNF